MGEGKPLALSPDGKWALVLHQAPPQQLVLLPIGPVESKQLPRGPIQEYRNWAAWSSDGAEFFSRELRLAAAAALMFRMSWVVTHVR
jgi:hypothetical protein